MAFAELSTVLVYKKDKCLVKSVQDIIKDLFFMVVRPRVLWTYVQRVYGRTSLGGKDVRPEGAWTYVHRTFERAWMGMNETCVKSIDSEQFLNGNEWDTEMK